MFKILIENTFRYFSHIHISGIKPDIFIVTTPRSGSTWLMEILTNEKGIKTCNEPLNLRREKIIKTLDIKTWVNLQSPESDNKIILYLNKISEGRFQTAYKNPIPFTRNYRFFTNRTLFKILHGLENKIDIIESKMNGKIVVLFRHPVPVSLSRDKLPRINSFFVGEYSKQFSEEQLKYARTIIDHDSFIYKAVLDWCFQNAMLLKFKHDQICYITYEQMVMQPQIIIQHLADYLMLDKDFMLQIDFHRPSLTLKKSKKKRIELFESNRNKESIISSWTQNKSIDLGKIQEILDVFSIEAYHTSSVYPKDNLYLP